MAKYTLKCIPLLCVTPFKTGVLQGTKKCVLSLSTMKLIQVEGLE